MLRDCGAPGMSQFREILDRHIKVASAASLDAVACAGYSGLDSGDDGDDGRRCGDSDSSNGIASVGASLRKGRRVADKRKSTGLCQRHT